MTLEKYNNTKCKYKIMAKCRLCGEVFDVYDNDNNFLVITPKDADIRLSNFYNTCGNNILFNETYVHRHEDGSYGLADFAGLIYEGEEE